MIPAPGDDIVDLKTTEPALHDRYVERVFTINERSKIGASIVKLWLYWAAKEAAFKALSRNNEGLIFSPIMFEFEEGLGVVNNEHGQVKCIWHIEEDYVHVRAYQDNEDTIGRFNISSWVGELPKGADPSVYLRESICDQLSKNLSIPIHLISIASSSKNKKGWTLPPSIYIDGQESFNLLSLSHHGRFISYTLHSPL